MDTGDTYYGYNWNFARYYSRTLVTYKSAVGAEGATLVPDLAASLGEPSADAKTWTYTLKDGLKFQDGSPITSAEIKYAVERSLDKKTFTHGPTYFNTFLDGVKDGFSVYNGDTLDSIETPDAKTIVFKLNQPFSGFDFFATLPATAPVPKKADTGSKYKERTSPPGPTSSRTTRTARASPWSATTSGTRPPTRSARPCRTRSRCR